MKEILLLRHAKSSWKDASLKDFDRPLAKRGLKDAPRMGEYIRKCKSKPAAIFSSPAQRAKETTKLICEGAKLDESIIGWNEDLYFGSVKDYLAAIREAAENYERILLVGHNPLMENTASVLAGAEQKVAVRMPTAALVCLESFADKWESITPGTCKIKWMMIPKVLNKLED